MRGESPYDRVTSLLMAVVLGALIVVGWLALIYATSQAYASRVTAPLEIIEVEGGGGGRPEGTPGATEAIDVPGADPGSAASNNEAEAADFEEPAVERTPAATIDAVAEAAGDVAALDLAPAMDRGGPVAGGRRASKIGTGGLSFGFGDGPGDGGVRREDRWSILFTPGQTAEEYARQLDALGVELATISQGQMVYAAHFSGPNPTRRTGTGQGDDRLYFLWQGQGRKASDVALLARAGVDVGEGVIFHFYPKGVEETLAQLEVGYRGRQPGEIRVTRFGVVPQGDGYGFVVLDQQTSR
ncbi:MAG TPA: hypothetical protein VF590_18320 [Isosphaeraceae bacterium]